MAKRKLSAARRNALRADMKRRIAAKVPTPRILEELAKKYSISTETGRWYLKSMGKAGGKPRAKRKPKPRRTSRASARPARRGSGGRLLAAARSLSRGELRRAIAAQDLLPRLDAARKKEQSLAREESRVRKALRHARRTARQLERRLRRLARA